MVKIRTKARFSVWGRARVMTMRRVGFRFRAHVIAKFGVRVKSRAMGGSRFWVTAKATSRARSRSKARTRVRVRVRDSFSVRDRFRVCSRSWASTATNYGWV